MPLADLNEGLKGGGAAPFWPSKNPGDAIQGTIKDGGKFQGTEYSTNPNVPGKPDTWPNGDPKWTYFLVLEGTGVRTQDGEDTWTVALTSHRFTAAQEALKAADATEFKEGGRFGIRYVGERPNRAGTAQYKHFEAYYEPPAVSAGWGMGQANQAPQSKVQMGTEYVSITPEPPQPQPAVVANGGWPTPSAPAAQQAAPDAGHTVAPAWPTPPQGGRQLT